MLFHSGKRLGPSQESPVVSTQDTLFQPGERNAQVSVPNSPFISDEGSTSGKPHAYLQTRDKKAGRQTRKVKPSDVLLLVLAIAGLVALYALMLVFNYGLFGYFYTLIAYLVGIVAFGYFAVLLWRRKTKKRQKLWALVFVLAACVLVYRGGLMLADVPSLSNPPQTVVKQVSFQPHTGRITTYTMYDTSDDPDLEEFDIPMSKYYEGLDRIDEYRWVNALVTYLPHSKFVLDIQFR